jgi:hypothetical protein
LEYRFGWTAIVKFLDSGIHHQEKVSLTGANIGFGLEIAKISPDD